MDYDFKDVDFKTISKNNINEFFLWCIYHAYTKSTIDNDICHQSMRKLATWGIISFDHEFCKLKSSFFVSSLQYVIFLKIVNMETNKIVHEIQGNLSEEVFEKLSDIKALVNL